MERHSIVYFWNFEIVYPAYNTTSYWIFCLFSIKYWSTQDYLFNLNEKLLYSEFRIFRYKWRYFWKTEEKLYTFLKMSLLEILLIFWEKQINSIKRPQISPNMETELKWNLNRKSGNFIKVQPNLKLNSKNMIS